MELQIQFLEGPPPMRVGGRARLRVNGRDAAGAAHPVPLSRVRFSFHPVEWGRIVPTSDPGLGLLEVTTVQESDDVLEAPAYTIQAALKAEASATLKSERRIRLVADCIEVPLQFEVGEGASWKPFQPGDLSQPLDWARATVGDPTTQTIVMRNGQPSLRIQAPGGLPAQVRITFPNGQVAALQVHGSLRFQDEAAGPPPLRHVTQRLTQEEIQAAAPEPLPSETLREELTRLRRYVSSFEGARREGRVGAGIRDRVEREVARVQQRIDGYPGSDREELQVELAAIASDADVAQEGG